MSLELGSSCEDVARGIAQKQASDRCPQSVVKASKEDREIFLKRDFRAVESCCYGLVLEQDAKACGRELISAACSLLEESAEEDEDQRQYREDNDPCQIRIGKDLVVHLKIERAVETCCSADEEHDDHEVARKGLCDIESLGCEAVVCDHLLGDHL